MHVAQGGGEVGVPGEFLDGLRRRAFHREQRAERVTVPVDATVHLEPGPAIATLHQRNGALMTLHAARRITSTHPD